MRGYTGCLSVLVVLAAPVALGNCDNEPWTTHNCQISVMRRRPGFVDGYTPARNQLRWCKWKRKRIMSSLCLFFFLAALQASIFDISLLA
jgi:hypothetical protein